MGGQADATEDMFSKLESMRAVITEVNTQFKDPVRVVITVKPILFLLTEWAVDLSPPYFTGEDDVRLRVHIRVPLTVRDGAVGAGTDGVRNRHAQHCRESASIPEGR
jgi:hypothetical protein